MIPVRVTAKLLGQLAHPTERIALDSLLAAMVARREGWDPPASFEEHRPIEIPIERSACGRFHLVSHSMQQVEDIEQAKRYINRRPVVAEMQSIGRHDVRTMSISGGPSKGYRMHLETGFLVDDEMPWVAMATDIEEVQALLDLCTRIGRRRGVGLGEIREWRVELLSLTETWDGFPILWEGEPLRPLPHDTEGLTTDAEVLDARLTYPYHCGPTDLVAVPRPAEVL